MYAQVRDMWLTLRGEGPRAAAKKYGWKFLALVVAYYLVRDTVLYILLPALAWYALS